MSDVLRGAKHALFSLGEKGKISEQKKETVPLIPPGLIPKRSLKPPRKC